MVSDATPPLRGTLWTGEPGHGSMPRHDSVFDETPDKTIEFMRANKQPWIAYKVLGAGAIKPLDGSPVVLDADSGKQVHVLLNGQNNATPSWKQLNDTEIAAVIDDEQRVGQLLLDDGRQLAEREGDAEWDREDDRAEGELQALREGAPQRGVVPDRLDGVAHVPAEREPLERADRSPGIEREEDREDDRDEGPHDESDAHEAEEPGPPPRVHDHLVERATHEGGHARASRDVRWVVRR